MPTYADLVLVRGAIFTMNPKQPSAEAVAVKGDKIMLVGSDQEIKNLIGKNTKVINLEGKTVLPGFIDTHIHVADYGRLLSWFNLESVCSIKQIQNLLSQRIKQTKKGKWVLGKSLDPTRLEENRSLTKEDLDLVSPENPVVLYYQSGQVCVANSKALEAAKAAEQQNVNVESNTQTGEPTGILRDDATNLVWNVIPEPTQEELYDTTKMALQEILKAGITRIHWIVLSETELPVIKKIVDTNQLNVRVYLIVPANLLDKAIKTLKGTKNKYLKLGGAIIFADGYLASRTAALNQPYSDKPNEQGKLLCPKNEMLSLAEKIQAAGLQLIIHAVGDKAVEEALNVIDSIKNKKSNVPPRLEQAAVLSEKLVQRIKEQQVIVSIQPCVVASEFSVWSAADRLGINRVKWLFPVKTLIENNIRVVAGSDCPMEPLNPLMGIKSAVEKDNQQVTFMAALQMYTIDAAFASSQEENEGSIEVGKLANLVFLKKALDMGKVGDNSVLQTIIDGKTRAF